MKHYFRIIQIAICLLSVILNSCISWKDLVYLNGPTDNANAIFSEGNVNLLSTPDTYKILHFDILFIRVLTPDPQWSELFNTSPIGSGGAMTEESASLVGYPVDDEGNIEIPFIGKYKVAGNPLSEIKSGLDSIFKDYVSDAAITVRLVNSSISILGEVNSPGRYSLSKERMSIFDALSMAGDMGPYSNRKKVKLIRPTLNGNYIQEFTLTDRSILTSEFYYVMPNDVIYALPLKGRTFQLNSSIWSLFLTTLTSALGIIAFFRTL